MCKIKAPAAPDIKIEEASYLKNPFLDGDKDQGSLLDSLRSGRNALKIDLNKGLGLGFGGRMTSGNPGNTYNPAFTGMNTRGNTGTSPTTNRQGTGNAGTGGGTSKYPNMNHR